jgi:2Fe-2S ferredoxin
MKVVIVAEVRVEPVGLTLTLDAGESLLEGASRIGVRWPTICHGNAECLVCWVQVLAGEENIVPAGPMEIKALEILRSRQSSLSSPLSAVRLACQIRFTGDAIVERAGLNL